MNPSFRFRKQTFAIAVAMLAPLCASAASTLMTWTVDGTERQAIVYAPAHPNGKAPLIFSFHGHGDTMDNFQDVDLQHAWPEAIVVYPLGLPTSRASEPALPGWQLEKGKYGDRDLKLVDQALAALHHKFSIDDTRVYATGFSNGANFTYLLWAERPATFAAFAPVAARLAPSVAPQIPKPLLHIAGLNDGTIPFAAQKQAIDAARRVNHVSDKAEACGPNCMLYSSRNGAPVMTIIHRGGHEYPLGTSERIVQFFQAHRLGD